MDKRIDAEARLLRLNAYFCDPDGNDDNPPGATIDNDSFLGGRLGLLFYLYHLAGVTGNDLYASRAEEMLAAVFDNINDGGSSLPGTAYSSGLTGFSFVLSFLNKEGYIGLDIKAELEDVDRLLFDMACVQIEQDCIDYLHGAFGIIHYFAQRQPDEQISFYLDTLIEKACGRRLEEGDTCWFRNNSLRTADKNCEEINFSLSHGLTGILLILLNAYAVSSHKALIRSVLESGIRFIQKHRVPEIGSADGHTLFPFAIHNGQNPFAFPDRMAWCYGDLNEVLLLYRAGKLLQDSSLTGFAEEVGRRSSMRKTASSTMITDSHFCHGSSGIAQFYRVLYEESGSLFYLDAYDYWIGQTLQLLDKDLEKDVFRGKTEDYLEGLVGVAFTLLSYTTDKKLNWSKSLLL